MDTPGRQRVRVSEAGSIPIERICCYELLCLGTCGIEQEQEHAQNGERNARTVAKTCYTINMPTTVFNRAITQPRT